MSVLSWLLVAPMGLLVILGLSWFEEHVLQPPASPADQVLEQVRQNTASAEQGEAPALSLVRAQPRRRPPGV